MAGADVYTAWAGRLGEIVEDACWNLEGGSAVSGTWVRQEEALGRDLGDQP
jgi:hypothetical protein